MTGRVKNFLSGRWEPRKPESDPETLQLGIAELSFSPYTLKWLTHHGFRTVGDLVSRQPAYYRMCVHHIHDTHIAEIDAALEPFNLRLPD